MLHDCAARCILADNDSDQVQFSNEFEEYVACTVNLGQSKNNKLHVLTVGKFRSLNSSNQNNSHLIHALLGISILNPSHLLIMGDFNYKEINWYVQYHHHPACSLILRSNQRIFSLPTR